MPRTIALALLLCAAPLAADELDVHALYEKWKAEESRTLEGWRVLDDYTLIEQIGPLAARWKDGALISPKEAAPQANALMAIAHIKGVGGAPLDWIVARHYAAAIRNAGLAESGYIAYLLDADVGTPDDLLNIVAADIAQTAGEEDRFVVKGFTASAYVFALSELGCGEARQQQGVARLKAAAEADCLPAMVSLARLHLGGGHPTPSAEEGVMWLERAANANYLPAWIELAELFHFHHGKSPDLNRCREYFKRAASLGSMRAMRELEELPERELSELNVGALYARYLLSWGELEEVTIDSGLATHTYLVSEPNRELARYPNLAEWLRTYADPLIEQSVPEVDLRRARLMYGECFLRGTGGVERDLRTATLWLYRASDDSDGPSCLLLHDLRVLSTERIPMASDYLLKAIQAEFAPALRAQCVVNLHPGRFSYSFLTEAESEAFALTEPAAVEQLGVLAKDGDLAAMRILRRYYTDADPADAPSLYWLKFAADHGDAEAWLTLGVLSAHGRIPKVDNADATRWYTKALGNWRTRPSALAFFESQKILAALGGVAALMRDSDASLTKWGDIRPLLDAHPFVAGVAQVAHAAHHADGTIVYGICLAYGHGVTANPAQARKLLLSFPDTPLASFLVGRMMEDGVGFRKADTRGAIWVYEAVAAEGGVYADHRLGRMYRAGIGVVADDKIATDHFKTAAEGGCIPAMVELAKAYRDGLGVVADEAKAKEWAKKAADEGDEAAKALLDEWK